MKIDFMIQNRVSEHHFETAAFDWLSEGAYTPNDIFEQIVTEHNLMLFPLHYFKLVYAGVASASLGYNRKEVHYVYNEYTKRQEKKTETVTDWKPHSQQVFGKASATVYAGDSRFDFMREFIESSNWGTNDLMELNEEASKDDKLLTLYKMNPANAWEQHGQRQSHEEARKNIINSFPSRKVRNLDINIQIEIEHYSTIVLPFWVFMYKYKGEPYYVAVDGNNPSRINGIRPKDKKRKGLVRGIRIIGYYLAINSLGLGILVSDGLTNLGIFSGFFFLFLIAIFLTEMFVGIIKRKAKKKRKEILQKRRQALG